MKHNKTLVLFSYDWDRIEFRKLSREWAQLRAGFDLFSFPSNARLAATQPGTRERCSCEMVMVALIRLFSFFNGQRIRRGVDIGLNAP